MHFFATYATASISCAPALEPAPSLTGAQWMVALYTVVALSGIGLVGWSGYRRHGYGAETAPHDADSPEDRHRFLGLATALLAGLSAVATIYVAASTSFFATCGA